MWAFLTDQSVWPQYFPVTPENFAKYIKLEPIDRKKHLNEDMSHKLSPFKNRIAVKDQYKSTLGYQTLA